MSRKTVITDTDSESDADAQPRGADASSASAPKPQLAHRGADSDADEDADDDADAEDDAALERLRAECLAHVALCLDGAGGGGGGGAHKHRRAVRSGSLARAANQALLRPARGHAAHLRGRPGVVRDRRARLRAASLSSAASSGMCMKTILWSSRTMASRLFTPFSKSPHFRTPSLTPTTEYIHFVEDLHSTNETCLGPDATYPLIPRRAYQLSHGSFISFGPVKCIYEFASAPPSSSAVVSPVAISKPELRDQSTSTTSFGIDVSTSTEDLIDSSSPSSLFAPTQIIPSPVNEPTQLISNFEVNEDDNDGIQL
ncbi:hypothetical protein BDR26DRAFT_935461 [Obelidium mucronatum]|nr:hypothetical protein BDR26DRAFT_935461 [Obelidium mucronatum]